MKHFMKHWPTNLQGGVRSAAEDVVNSVFYVFVWNLVLIIIFSSNSVTKSFLATQQSLYVRRKVVRLLQI